MQVKYVFFGAFPSVQWNSLFHKSMLGEVIISHKPHSSLTKATRFVHFRLRRLQVALHHPPEEGFSLLGAHVLAALQEIGHDQGLLYGGGAHPHAPVHPQHRFTGKQLLQVLDDVTLRGQQPGGGGAGEGLVMCFTYRLSYTSNKTP